MNPTAERLLDRVPARLRSPLELVVDTVGDAIEDRVPGLAAEIAFFVLLSLPPLVLTLLAGIGTIARAFDATWHLDLAFRIRQGAALVFQPSAQELVDDIVGVILEDGQVTVFGIGFLLALVSASRALRVVVEMITIAYDLEQTRPTWKQRLWGAGLTVAGLMAAVVIAPLVLVGPGFGDTLSRVLNGVPGLPSLWAALYWPTAAVLVTVLVAVLYHLAAPWTTPLRRDLPGAALAVGLWLIGSVVLRAYAAGAIVGDPVYRPVAGPLVVLLWLYVSAFALLLGAEFNAELEKRRDRHPSETAARALSGSAPR